MICDYCGEEIKVEHWSYRQCLKSKDYKIKQLEARERELVKELVAAREDERLLRKDLGRSQPLLP